MTTAHPPPVRGDPATVAVVGSPTESNVLLASRWRLLGSRAVVLSPVEAVRRLRPQDVALVRLDVLPSLDGVEPGLEEVESLRRLGVRVLNEPVALLAMHDKLVTARVLAANHVAQPGTVHVTSSRADQPGLPLPGVLKPRFGSWGRDVVRYETAEERGRALAWAASRPWWRRHGALAQELVEGPGRDLRVLVVAGRVVGAASRVAAPGEWRTNVSLGGRLEHAVPDAEAAALAEAAARAVGAAIAGVDLLRGPSGWVVLELNGAVDFDAQYTFPGDDLYLEIALALRLPGAPDRGSAPSRPATTARPPVEPSGGLRVAGRRARRGDLIEIVGEAVGGATRTAEILEVFGESDWEHFRVRWEDGHETVYYAGEEAVVRPAPS